MSKKITFPALKAAFVYAIKGDAFSHLWANWQDMQRVQEPAASAWGSQGWVHANGTEYPIEQNGMLTLCWQTNEKILPAKVRDEVLAGRVRDIEDRQGRKVGKKEYAQLRDEVCHELLPRAFTRRNLTLVTVTDKGELIIWTSSAKRCDAITSALIEFCSDFKISQYQTRQPMGNALTALCRGDAQDDLSLIAGSNAVLKLVEEGAPVIRVRNKDLGSDEVQALFKRGYQATEAHIIDTGNGNFSATVTDRLVFKKMAFGEISMNEGSDQDDVYAVFATNVFLCTKALLRMWQLVVDEAGGVIDLGNEAADEGSDELATATEEEDEEL